MSERELRATLTHIADDVRVVDLGPGVRARTQVLRRRRRAAAVAVPVVAALAAAALLANPSEPSAAPPAGPRGAPTVELTEASTDPLGAGASLGVVDRETGTAWLVTRGGLAAQAPVPTVLLPGAPAVLSAGGRYLTFGSSRQIRWANSVDGSTGMLAASPGPERLVAVSPDGRTAAYATDNQVDAVELTLTPLDGGAPTTLPVTATAAAGTLVPVIWSDDGSAVLVLDGMGATRVDLDGEPRPARGAHVKEDLVLSYGWAAAPDLSRFAMGATRTLAGGQRQWMILDSESGEPVEAVVRRSVDRLIGWTPDDRLVWWLPTGDGYTVLTTDTGGQSPRTEMRVVSDVPNLLATWTEDMG